MKLKMLEAHANPGRPLTLPKPKWLSKGGEISTYSKWNFIWLDSKRVPRRLQLRLLIMKGMNF